MRLRPTLFVGAAWLVVAGAAAAQVPVQTPPAPKGTAPAAKAPAAAMVAGRATGMARATDIVGTEIMEGRNSVGEVRDVLTNDGGEAVLVIERKAQGDVVAAPLGLFEPHGKQFAGRVEQGAATGNVDTLILTGDADVFASAPVIPDADKLATLDDAWWTAYAAHYAGPPKDPPAKDPPSEAGTTSAPATVRRGTVVSIREIIGQHVKTTAAEDLGTITDVAVDLGTRRLAYVIVSSEGPADEGPRLHGVALGAMASDPEHHRFTLNTIKEIYDQHPGIDLERLPSHAAFEAAGTKSPGGGQLGEAPGVDRANPQLPPRAAPPAPAPAAPPPAPAPAPPKSAQA